MWKEYAVQPESLVQSKDAFRALFYQFGWEQGRLLAKYPAKDWLRMVYESAQQSALRDVERSSVCEWLRNGDHRLVKAGRPYDPGIGWLENAEAQQSKAERFDGIITVQNPRAHPDVVLADELNDETPVFQSPAQILVSRKVVDMVASVRPLLNRSREIIFVDPHFGCLERRFLTVLSGFLEVIIRDKNPVERIEYHLAQSSLVLDHAEFFRRLRRHICDHIPVGSNITFFVWKQKAGGEKLHDRYILTERGGVQFSVGLDEGELGETTMVSRLSRSVYDRVWRHFSEETAAFKLTNRTTISGLR